MLDFSRFLFHFILLQLRFGVAIDISFNFNFNFILFYSMDNQNTKLQTSVMDFVSFCLFVCFFILFHLFSTVENKIKHLDFKRSEIKVLLDAKDDCFFLLLSVRVYVWVAESIKKVCAVAKKKHGSLSWYFMPECLERLLLFFRSPKLLGSIATLRTVQFWHEKHAFFLREKSSEIPYFWSVSAE